LEVDRKNGEEVMALDKKPGGAFSASLKVNLDTLFSHTLTIQEVELAGFTADDEVVPLSGSEPVFAPKGHEFRIDIPVEPKHLETIGSIYRWYEAVKSGNALVIGGRATGTLRVVKGQEGILSFPLTDLFPISIGLDGLNGSGTERFMVTFSFNMGSENEGTGIPS
jgi:hypothetical protein